MKKQLSYLSFIFLSLSLNSLADFAYTSGSSGNIVISTSNDESGYEGANALTSGFTSTPSDNWSSFKRGMYNWYGVASSSSTTLTDGTSINGEYIQISNSDSTAINLEELLVFEPLSVPYHDASNYYARTAHLVGSNDSSALSAGSGNNVWELLSSTTTVSGDGSTLKITDAPDTYVKIENTTEIGYKYYRYVISETGNNPYRTGASGIAISEFVDTDGDSVGDNADVHPGFNDAELTTYLSNNNYAKTSEIIDARAGSTLITVSNGVATVELEMEQSDDLQTWSEIDGSTSMDIPADASVKFFRFKMAD